MTKYTEKLKIIVINFKIFENISYMYNFKNRGNTKL